MSRVTINEPETARSDTKIAVIGTGTWGKRLVGALCAQKGVSVVALVDKDIDAATAVTRLPLGLEQCEIFSSLEILAKATDIGVDAVVIATPSDTHETLIRNALNHGYHVFSEPPYALTTVEATNLVNLASESGLVLHMDLHMRFDPCLFLKDKIGDIRYIHYVLKGPSGRGDGLTDLGSIAIDTVMSMVSKNALHLSCHSVQVNDDLLYICRMDFEDGTIAVIETGFCLLTTVLEHKIDITGTKGNISIAPTPSTVISDQLWFGPCHTLVGFTPCEAIRQWIIAVKHTAESEMSPTIGLRCVQAVVAAFHSLENDGWNVKLKLVEDVKKPKLARMLQRWRSMPSFKALVRGAELYPPVARDTWKERELPVTMEKLALDDAERERQSNAIKEKIERKAMRKRAESTSSLPTPQPSPPPQEAPVEPERKKKKGKSTRGRGGRRGGRKK